MIAQGAILILSAAGIWILSWRGTSRWGWIVGLAAQPFWLWVTFSAGQWLLFVNAVVWSGAFAHGLIKHWNAADPTPAKELEDALRCALVNISIAARILERDGDEHGVAWNLRNTIRQYERALELKESRQ